MVYRQQSTPLHRWTQSHGNRMRRSTTEGPVVEEYSVCAPSVVTFSRLFNNAIIWRVTLHSLGASDAPRQAVPLMMFIT